MYNTQPVTSAHSAGLFGARKKVRLTLGLGAHSWVYWVKKEGETT